MSQQKSALKFAIATVEFVLKLYPDNENLKGQLTAYTNCLSLFEEDNGEIKL